MSPASGNQQPRPCRGLTACACLAPSLGRKSTQASESAIGNACIRASPSDGRTGGGLQRSVRLQGTFLVPSGTRSWGHPHLVPAARGLRTTPAGPGSGWAAGEAPDPGLRSTGPHTTRCPLLTLISTLPTSCPHKPWGTVGFHILSQIQQLECVVYSGDLCVVVLKWSFLEAKK